MNAGASLFKVLLSAGTKGKKLASEAGHVLKGGKEILGGAPGVMGAGGRAAAMKQLLQANKGGASALGGLGALGAGGSAYGANKMLGDDENEDDEDILERLGLR